MAGDAELGSACDYRSRRVRKLVLPWNPALNGGQGGWDDSNPALDRRSIWDGWLLLAELDDNGDVVRKYAWGLDLSGTMGSAGVSPVGGAGGIGGLLAIHDVDDPADPGDPYGDFIVFSDGAGNVGQLIDWSGSGAVVAHYEYDPYGGLMAGSYGTYADTNPLRFSTKYFDAELDWPEYGSTTSSDGLYYFGRRYYEPRWGRWTNRDPLRELGGVNLYGYVHNWPPMGIDPLGLQELQIDSSLNAWERISFKDVEKACKSVFQATDTNDFADYDEILEHLRTLGPPDVWVYFGHGGVPASGGPAIALMEHDGPVETILRMIALGLAYGAVGENEGEWQLEDGLRNDPVHLNPLLRAATYGGKGPPSLMVIAGCRGCDIAKAFLDVGATCILCTDKDVSLGIAGGFLKDFLLALCKGKGRANTLRQAFNATNRKNAKILARELESERGVFKLMCKDGKDKDKTLAQLLGLKAEEKKSAE